MLSGVNRSFDHGRTVFSHQPVAEGVQFVVESLKRSGVGFAENVVLLGLLKRRTP
jgi:hypothetical protein